MHPDAQLVYAILREWARARSTGSYKLLSERYRDRTNVWFEPHGSWDGLLGALNRQLHGAGAPALSAVVVLQVSGEPGGGFWGCAPSVPSRPNNAMERVQRWSGILQSVYSYPWPERLP